MRNRIRRLVAMVRRRLDVALLLAAADPTLPPATRALLVDQLSVEVEPVSRRRGGL